MKKIVIMFLAGWIAVTGNAWAAKAKAEIKGTTPESLVTGLAAFEDTDKGLAINVEVSNLTPGAHGFHIHEKGSCEEAGNAAGGHFNPAGVQHGFLPKDGLTAAHAGDFGNIEVGEDGKGNLQLLVPGLTLQGGQYDVAGHAVIVHEKKDDLGQPTGNAGGRIGCGIIEVSE